MSMRALLAATQEFTALLNTVNESGRDLTQHQMRKYEDLTRNEVWWTHAQAVITGITSGLGGAAGVVAPLIPAGQQVARMSTDTIKAVLKAFGTGSTVIGDIGNTVAKGNTITNQSKRSLVERCDISRLQQEDGARNSSYSQVMQALQAIFSAKARIQ